MQSTFFQFHKFLNLFCHLSVILEIELINIISVLSLALCTTTLHRMDFRCM